MWFYTDSLFKLLINNVVKSKANRIFSLRQGPGFCSGGGDIRIKIHQRQTFSYFRIRKHICIKYQLIWCLLLVRICSSNFTCAKFRPTSGFYGIFGNYLTQGGGSGSGRIQNVFLVSGSGSGIIIPDPDPTLKKKKVGSLTFSFLKRGEELTGNC